MSRSAASSPTKTAPARQGWRKLVLPEIHDLYPSVTPSPAELLSVFPARARDCVALSIVPDWQGRDPIADAPDFAAQIRKMGGLRVLHGWTHSLGPSLIDWIMYGHDNRSEFRSQSREAAEGRLQQALAGFEAAFGERPRWFCAPRWQESAGTLDALHSLGFDGSLSRAQITRFGAAPIPLPALNFDEGERSLPIRLNMALRKGAIRRLLQAERPFRLVVHPHDLAHAATRTQLTDTLQALDDAGWEFLSLHDTIARWEAR